MQLQRSAKKSIIQQLLKSLSFFFKKTIVYRVFDVNIMKTTMVMMKTIACFVLVFVLQLLVFTIQLCLWLHSQSRFTVCLK